MTLPLAAFLLLQVLDALTTHRALSMGGRELNPFLRAVIDDIGILPALAVMKIPGCLFFILIPVPAWGLWAICAGYVGVVANNVFVIRKLR